MGVPFTVIVGDSTLETGAVAVRNRDTSIRVCMLVIPLQTVFLEGILFSRCPCVHASVRNILFP